MIFQTISCDLGKGFSFYAKYNGNQYEVLVKDQAQEIGKAIITTDFVDIECITLVQFEKSYINCYVTEEHLLLDAFIKFLSKFPGLVRKPEFRFILGAPLFLTSHLEKFHFNKKENESFYWRQSPILPSKKSLNNLTLTSEFSENTLNLLLDLLKNNAYWQSHLTIERLRLLVSNSHCVFAFKTDRLVGFSRILTDKKSFASLWDVVVEETERNQGIAQAMMFEIFSDPNYYNINQWFLFTDTAEGLYSKFGFVKDTLTSESLLTYKVRLQEELPKYMDDVQCYANLASAHLALNFKQSISYLFEIKRSQQSSFWSKLENQKVESDEADILSQSIKTIKK